MNLTFLNGAFLFAALAALLPLLIHLISRRRVATVDFSSLRFLKELERKRIRRVRLRQILLLIVRSLIILAAALALARPTLKGSLAGRGSHARTSVAIVIDTSASMSRMRAGSDLLSEATRAAVDIAGLLEEGDQAFLVTAGTPAAARLDGGTFSKDVLVSEIAGLAPTSRATDLDSAVALARDLLADSRNLNRELYLIGDMQRTGWAGSMVATEPDLHAAAASRDGRPRAYVLQLSGPVTNLGVSSVEVERRHGTASGAFSVSARVANHGPRSGEAMVRLVVDGEQVGQAGIETAAGGAATARFTVSVDESSWHEGFAELPVDALEADNRCYFAIPAARRIEVLVVRPGGFDEPDDADYVVNALDPTGDSARFSPLVVAADALARQDEGRFPIVVLADVGRLDASGLRWLTSHVESGGGVLLVLGSRTDVRFWNGGFLSEHASAEIVAPIERRGGVRLAPAAQGHPMLDGLVFGERLIDDIVVSSAFDVRAEGEETVLELPGLGPALFIAGRGARSGTGGYSGEIAVLTTGVDPEWSELPRSGFIVPLMHRLVERLSRTGSGSSSAAVGDDLVVDMSEPVSGRVEVEMPGGETVTASVRPDGASAVVEVVKDPGVYRFLESGRTVALGVVNVDPLESDLAPLDTESLAGRLSPMPVTRLDTNDELQDVVLRARYGRELWRVMLYLALALVAVEMFLARPRFA